MGLARGLPCDVIMLTQCSHIKRVLGYLRPRDYALGAAFAVSGPIFMRTLETFAPSHVGKGGFAPIMRLSWALSLGGAFLAMCQQSSCKSTYRLLLQRHVVNMPQTDFTVSMRINGSKRWT